RQFPTVKMQASSPEMLAQMDAVTENLIREAIVVPEPAPLRELSPFDITAIARESVGGALQEAMANLMVGSKGGAWRPDAARREEKPSLSQEDLKDTIRESVAEAIADLAVQAKATGNAPSTPPADLCEMIRDSVAAAVQESMAARTPESQAEAQETLRAAVQEALRDDEAATVTRTRPRDLEMRDAERAKRRKHASVSTFVPARAGIEGFEARLESDEHVLAALNSDRLLGEFRFDSFVVGKGNVFTVKLCRAVAGQPGGDYNPFFIYGEVGLGKTHLVNAIGNAIAEAQPDARIGYVSSSRFATRLVEAVRDGAADAFRANYCHWDVLILDDIQFLGGRVDAQEEFFNIFNVLQQQHRQIIIAGDKPPDRLGMLEQRLISRFSGGIVANVRPPEFDARVAILKKQMAQGGAALSDEILALVATRVTHDMRKMIGALRKILAYANLLEGKVSCETANDILLQLGIDEAA
ncbi:MAG: DnaA/Hda family protein, partial [Candidatus Hydrogenedentes bacterium]|nr:DnaA/Hda family protein [Candidatus Hydrogenedentota bacterium]